MERYYIIGEVEVLTYMRLLSNILDIKGDLATVVNYDHFSNYSVSVEHAPRTCTPSVNDNIDLVDKVLIVSKSHQLTKRIKKAVGYALRKGVKLLYCNTGDIDNIINGVQIPLTKTVQAKTRSNSKKD